nr:hypothetical protein [Salinisphaera sp. Q1T1-3]
MPLTTLDPNAELVVVDLQKGLAALPFVHPIEDVVARNRGCSTPSAPSVFQSYWSTSSAAPPAEPSNRLERRKNGRPTLRRFCPRLDSKRTISQ